VGTCLADQGFHVTCVDRDEGKIAGLNDGQIPIYEPGLEDILRRVSREERIEFTTQSRSAMASADVIFIAVGTPPSEDGSADLSAVLAVAAEIGENISGPTTVVIKSTVPVGTATKVRAAISAATDHPVNLVSNPEFLKEGAAIADFTHPDRIVVGCDSDEGVQVMRTLYGGLVRTGRPIVFMDNQSAEITKYASNALLATKISFMNELSRLCEAVGADIEAVRMGTGSDSRIGPKFLFAGAGFGGSCFPKDIRALARMGEEAGVSLEIPGAVERINARQKKLLGEKVFARFGSDLSGKCIAVWGLAFKPRTDDVRESPALVLIRQLLAAGATVRVTDPEGMDEGRCALHGVSGSIAYVESALEAATGADAAVLVTEWNEFRNPDFAALKLAMRSPILFDGRNVFVPDVVRDAGFEYHGVGRTPPPRA
jgi:UDPglucose 6-dehydrogenase